MKPRRFGGKPLIKPTVQKVFLAPGAKTPKIIAPNPKLARELDVIINQMKKE